MELDLHATANDPPEIHTVAKNYIDLLYASPAGKGRLCKDDRQIKYLAVQYTLRLLDSPRIFLRAARLSAFLEDVDLACSINTGALGPDEADDHNDDEELEDIVEDLLRLERDRDGIIRRFGLNLYEANRRHLLSAFQQVWLAGSEQLLHRLLLGYLRPMPEPSRLSEDIPPSYAGEGHRTLLMSDAISLNLAGLPQRSGEGNQFKEAVEAALLSVKKRQPRLFPLLTQLAVTILVLPPERDGIDCDNLARRIVPRVHRLLEPPARRAYADPGPQSPPHLRAFYERQRHLAQRLPKHHVTRYEVVELRRNDADPPAGSVRLVFCDGSRGTTFGAFVRRKIDEWQARQ